MIFALRVCILFVSFLTKQQERNTVQTQTPKGGVSLGRLPQQHSQTKKESVVWINDTPNLAEIKNNGKCILCFFRCDLFTRAICSNSSQTMTRQKTRWKVFLMSWRILANKPSCLAKRPRVRLCWSKQPIRSKSVAGR